MKQKPKQKKKYRLKFTLSDGRRVYASKRGRIDIKSSTTELDHSVLLSWAYTPDLSLSSPRDFFLKNGIPFVAVIDYQWERVSQKIDQDAFIMGGTRVSALAPIIK